MTVAYRAPGVYLEESPLNNPPTDIGGSQSIAVFIGASSKGPIGQAVAIQSWSDYVARYGGFNKIENVSGGPLARNNVYVSRNTIADRNAINAPRLGDVCFSNDYRYTSQRFYARSGQDATAGSPGYNLPHEIFVYTGSALGWVSTGFQFHTENDFFGTSATSYATAGVSPNVIRTADNVNFFLSMGTDDDHPNFLGSPVPLDLGLNWSTTDDRWSLWIYGTSSYFFNSSGVFQGGGGSPYTPFSSGNTWYKVNNTLQNGVSAAQPAGKVWAPLFDLAGTTGPQTYIPLEDMPGAGGEFGGTDWAGWAPDLQGPTGNTVTALPYLPYAVNSFFLNGGKNAWIVRSASTSEQGLPASVDYSTSSDPSAPLSFTVEAVGSGTWGDDVGVNIARTATDPSGQVIFTVRVFLNGTEVERFPNITMLGTIPGTKRLDLAVNDPQVGSRYVQITNFDDSSLPFFDAPNTPRQLAGGTDPDLPSSQDLVKTASDTVTTVDGSLLVNIVGHTTNPTDPSSFVYPTTVTSSVIVGDSGRTNIFVVNDACPPRPSNKSSQDYMNQEIASTLSHASSVDSFVACYTPWIIIPDPAVPGGTIATPPGGAILGVFARTDTSVGVFQTPAGVNTGGIVNSLGVDTKFTGTQQGQLNAENVNVIRSVPGSGICIMGARTQKRYGVDQYIAPRRTLIYIEEALTAATQFAVFQNNDQRLWAKLSMTADRILRPLWDAGGLSGNSTAEAYYVLCDATVNTPNVVSSGEVRLEVGVALEYPAEFVVITVSQYDGTTFTTEVQPS
jgi:hypothetical protein